MYIDEADPLLRAYGIDEGNGDSAVVSRDVARSLAPPPPFVDNRRPVGGRARVPMGTKPLSTDYSESSLLADAIRAEESAAAEADAQAVESGVGGGAGVAVAAGPTRQQQLRGALFSTTTTPSRPNPQRPIVEREAAGVAAGAEVAQDASRAIPAATMHEMEGTAAAYRASAAEQQAIIDASEERRERDAQRERAALAAQEHVFKSMQDAVEKLKAEPEIDSRRYWSSLKPYQRFGHAISAIADGVRGLDPMRHLDAAIEREINVQRANFANKREAISAAGEELQASRSLFADLRAQIGDDQVASDATRVAYLELGKAQVTEAKLMAGIPLAVALASKEVGEFDVKIAKLQGDMQKRVAATPMRIGGGTRPTLTGPLRALAEKEYLKLLDAGLDADAAALKAQLDASARAGAGPSNTQRRLNWDQRRERIKEAKMAENLLAAIQSFKAKHEGKDISGISYGVGSHPVWFSDEDEIVQNDLGLIEDQLTTWMTGASSPKNMEARYRNMLRNPSSEGELWANLEMLASRANADIKRVNVGLDTDVRAHIEGVADPAKYAPNPAGGTPTTTKKYDDDEDEQ